MKRNILFILSSLLTITLSFNAYAFESSYKLVIENIKNGNRQLVETEGLHIESIDSQLYNKDINDSIRTGWTYDVSGDLYFSYDDGVLLRESYDKSSNYFNADGEWKPYGKYVSTKEMCENLEGGSTLKFNSLNDAVDFLNYYLLDYRLQDVISGFSLPRYSDGTVSLTLDDSKYYDREVLRAEILNVFGKVQGTTAEEKMFDTCERVKDYFNYDLSASHLDLGSAIAQKRGVCWHTTKAAQVLLEDAGVYTEQLFVKSLLDGESHVVLRCLSDGKWLYFDPTFSKVGLEYTNISYTDFLTLYAPIKYIKYTS